MSYLTSVDDPEKKIAALEQVIESLQRQIEDAEAKITRLRAENERLRESSFLMPKGYRLVGDNE